MAPGPFTSMATTAFAVAGLLGAPFVWNKLPTEAPPAVHTDSRIELSASSAAAPIEKEARSGASATTKTPPTESPGSSTPEVATPSAAKKSYAKEQWSSATPNDEPPAEASKPSSTSPPESPQAAKSSQPADTKEKVASPHQGEAKSKFEEKLREWASLAQPLVHELEAKVIAFDVWCTGPVLRQRLSVHLEAWGVWAKLEKWGVTSAAGSAVQGIGISSAAAAAIMSIALAADFGLLWLFVIWRLARWFPKSDDSPRKKIIEQMKKKAESEGTPANGAKGKKGGNGETKAPTDAKKGNGDAGQPPTSNGKKKGPNSHGKKGH